MSSQVLGEEAVIAALRAFDRRPGYSRIERMRDAVEALAPPITVLVTEARADERKRWQILNDAWARVVSKYTYAPGPGGNVERVAQLGADDMRPALVEWLRQQYRGFDAARGRS